MKRQEHINQVKEFVSDYVLQHISGWDLKKAESEALSMAQEVVSKWGIDLSDPEIDDILDHVIGLNYGGE